MKAVLVAAVGVWPPLGPDATAAPAAPPAELLPSRLRRGTSMLTRLFAEGVAQVAAQSGADLASVATVYGSANGEIETAIAQLQMMHGDGVLSPARFKSSVHNTASGLVSIAAGNRAFSTALAAGERTAAMCLLEAIVLIDRGATDVIVALADEPLPAPLPGAPRYAPLGVAFHLRAETPPNGRALAALRGLRVDATAPAATLAEPLGNNPVAAALPLVDAIRQGRRGTVVLERGGAGTSRWCIEVVDP